MNLVPKKIVWLASYPKSGNTWFRAFLTALLGEGELDINNLNTDVIFSSRDILEQYSGLPSAYLNEEEVKLLQPEVFNAAAKYCKNERLFVKVHDAYHLNRGGLPIIPTAPTQCALYFIRNPLDIVGSFASHRDSSTDEAIKQMNDPVAQLAMKDQQNGTNPQFRQLTLDWSGHVRSWTRKLPFPVMVLRYEDMLSNAAATFGKAVNFLGLDVTDEKLMMALDQSNFENLKQKEAKDGFRERNKAQRVFFRSGTMNNWIHELTDEQVCLVRDHHSDVMSKYGY